MPVLVLVVLRVCVILDPDPFAAPVTPDWATVQEYVVPEVVLLKEKEVALPEHSACEVDEDVTVGVCADVTAKVPAALMAQSVTEPA